MTKTESKTDYLVVGAGIAGLVAAYSLSEFGKVLVITKGKLKQSNTYWAQGGIAAVTDKEDSFESHAEDTTIAGAGHCNGFAVKYLVAHAPKAINFLKSIGVEFQEDPVLEAGHSFPRVLRTSDYTG
ncbi:FAD-dependent oxidoreductase, partial [Patescibacteria group bacterium]|nr:FAD-dependent oxidoreductase [Patescibacteria group bacterium]